MLRKMFGGILRAVLALALILLFAMFVWPGWVTPWLGLGGGSSFAPPKTSTAAPTNPSAPVLKAPKDGGGSVKLEWDKPASDGGAGILNYKIYRGDASGTETPMFTSDKEKYDDTTVTGSQIYFYKVTAVNKAGMESSLSNEQFGSTATPGPSASTTAAGTTTTTGTTTSTVPTTTGTTPTTTVATTIAPPATTTPGGSSPSGSTTGGPFEGGKTTFDKAGKPVGCGFVKPGYSGFVAKMSVGNAQAIAGGGLPAFIRVCRYGTPSGNAARSVKDMVSFGYSWDNQPPQHYLTIHFNGQDVQTIRGNWFVLPPKMPLGTATPVNRWAMDVPMPPNAVSGSYRRLCTWVTFGGYVQFPATDANGDPVPWKDPQMQHLLCRQVLIPASTG